MHTNFNTVGLALKFLREDCAWEGPIGCYPDHGHFTAPDWVFAELDNATAINYIEEWITKWNVQMIGGCCGLGPEFITAVSAYTRHHNATVRQREGFQGVTPK